ncbi:hypothetical protein P152DRAFT_503882 [Eremomyces bilateralis CBS 781.70]|uniref:Protein kinase domain-containing protein n=1 Tax=Eremomyces bilateralis CBS 781.70 TaxID=1392243 RepID=A0A6G1G3D4_9PEZI|nr:uncharacterized protein P152DRAFT_503882 [Eremomyces bilateralis CBS 781.70]KAF1812441.1 hypothetical protein P152DRAFT_503882 [Eremomyces bilateralis CBS 781.70]
MSQPSLSSLDDFESISEYIDTQTGSVRYPTCELFHDGYEYFGQIFKPKHSIKLPEYSEALRMVLDEEIYLEILRNLSIYTLVEDTPHLGAILHNEGQIIQQISKVPHPNIIGYHSVQHGGKIEIWKFMTPLASTVIYLHPLNLAHNDFNPENITVDDDVAQPGQRVISAGTPGWAFEEFTHSSKQHDKFALGALLLWLQGST